MLLVGLAVVMAWGVNTALGFLPPPSPTPPPSPVPQSTATPSLMPQLTATPSLVPQPTLTPTLAAGEFSGLSAMGFVADQLALGPRWTGSENGRKTADYIISRLRGFGWETEVQEFTYRGVGGRNIIAKAGTGPVAVIGAHYDTRRKADRDPDPSRRDEPVPGANDGASGVAVLMELARVLDTAKLTNEVWLTFFDAEDNGHLDGWEFSAGSEYMAASLSTAPEMVVVVDMIGDSDQNIYKERNSTPGLLDHIWSIAASLGYEEQFVPEYGKAITDDHVPFLRRGYLAADVIDFDYPAWHTTQDTIDKVSPASLERVGKVLQVLLERNASGP